MAAHHPKPVILNAAWYKPSTSDLHFIAPGTVPSPDIYQHAASWPDATISGSEQDHGDASQFGHLQ
jgi:hypothetical protein